MSKEPKNTADTTLWPALSSNLPSILENDNDASVFEQKYVHQIYDAIAPHYASTRTKRWPFVASFLQSLPPGSLLLDAGCGNGKYFYLVDCLNGYVDPLDSGSLLPLNLKVAHSNHSLPIVMTGVDASLPFLEPLYYPNYATPVVDANTSKHMASIQPARRIRLPEKWTGNTADNKPRSFVSPQNPPHMVKYIHSPPRRALAHADLLALPFRSSSFDAVMSIAVVHHFVTPARRIQALSELCRVVREGGRALVSAWAQESAGRPSTTSLGVDNSSSASSIQESSLSCSSSDSSPSSFSFPSHNTSSADLTSSTSSITSVASTTPPEVLVPWKLPSRYRHATTPAPPALPKLPVKTSSPREDNTVTTAPSRFLNTIATSESLPSLVERNFISTCTTPRATREDTERDDVDNSTVGPIPRSLLSSEQDVDPEEEMRLKWNLPPPPGMSRTQYRRNLKNQAEQRKRAKAGSASAVYLRYYHMFVVGELRQLADATIVLEDGRRYGWEIEDDGLMEENHFVVLRKVLKQ